MMYSDKERQIFEFFDGEKEVKGDPLAIHRKFLVRLKEEGHDLEALFSRLETPVDDVQQSRDVDIILPVIRNAFDVKPLNEGGLTEAETLSLLLQFLLYQDSLKKNAVSSRSGFLSSDGSQDGNDSPTKPIAGSRSTGQGSKTSRARRSAKG